jgi:hypothetical protein
VAYGLLEQVYGRDARRERQAPSKTADIAYTFSNNIIRKDCFRLIMRALQAYHVEFTPRNANGSKYSLHICEDIHGGWIVHWGKVCTWRYYSPSYNHSSEGELSFLCGSYNGVDTLAVREYLDGVAWLA